MRTALSCVDAIRETAITVQVIIKIYFADDAGTQLYLSSQNGEALQFSNPYRAAERGLIDEVIMPLKVKVSTKLPKKIPLTSCQ